MEKDTEIHALVQHTTSQIQAALCPTFEILFGMLFKTVSIFVIFCNLLDNVDILHDGAPGPAATKVRIEIRGFLQM